MRRKAAPDALRELKKFLKNLLRMQEVFCYTRLRCDMIAMKREVAALLMQVFRGANVM